jgi:hypothetical protein
MANTTTFTTYDLIGMAEDVSDVISDISPEDTPFQSMIGRDTVNARNPEWQEDALDNTVPVSMAEGAAFADKARAATTMRSNYTQIIGDAFTVSRTADRIKKYGRAKETAFQLVKAGKQLKNYLEIELFGAAQNASLGADEQAVRVFGNVRGTDPASAAIVTNSNTTSATARLYDEDVLKEDMLDTYNQGQPAKYIMIPPTLAIQVGNMATVNSMRFRDSGASKEIVMVVEMLVTPWGTAKVVLNRHAVAGTALYFDKAFWKLGTLDSWQKEKLAKTVDGERYSLVGEFTLIHTNYGEGLISLKLGAADVP